MDVDDIGFPHVRGYSNDAVGLTKRRRCPEGVAGRRENENDAISLASPAHRPLQHSLVLTQRRGLFHFILQYHPALEILLHGTVFRGIIPDVVLLPKRHGLHIL